ETVHRRGYRVIVPVQAAGESLASAPIGKAAEPETPPRPLSAAHRAVAVVGRDTAVQRPPGWFSPGGHGGRRVGVGPGEPGIGKTTVVDQWLAEAASGEAVWLAHGECVEQYGAAEPYLPVLGALGGLCRGPGGDRLVTLLGRHAPTWLVQMPGLFS